MKKPSRVPIMTHLDKRLAQRVRAAAKADGRSVSAQLARLIAREYGQEQPQPEA